MAADGANLQLYTPPFPEFVIDDITTVGPRWEKYVKSLERLFVAFGVDDDKRQRALLLYYCGDPVNEIFETFTDTGEDYKTAKDKLTAHFAPKRNKDYHRCLFGDAKQYASEGIVDFHTRLQQLTLYCEFADKDSSIKTQILRGCKSAGLRRKALRDSLSLTQIIEKKKARELADTQATEMEKSTSTQSQVNYAGHKKKPGSGMASGSNSGKKRSYMQQRYRKNTAHNPGTDAKAKSAGKSGAQKSCFHCGGSWPHPRGTQCPASGKRCNSCKKLNHFARCCNQSGQVNMNVVEPNLSSDDDYVFGLNNKDLPSVEVMFGSQQCTAYIDSCAGVNVMSPTDYDSLVDKPDLQKPKSLCFHMEDRFEGIGKLKGTQAKLHIDDSVVPVAQPHRRIPFHTRKKVEAEVKKLQDLDIIEPVKGDPTPWISPIHVVNKPKNPDQIRMCVDMRMANKAIARERHLTPTIDDILASLNGATVFSKLDLNAGYHQIELAEESRHITVFSTHVGLFRFKRLSFGINSAAEIFQNHIQSALGGLDGVLNMSDDILVYGCNQQEHDARLEACLQRISDRNLTLNRNKCQFSVRTIEFFGHVFSEHGVSPDPKKVEALKSAERPKTREEVSSLFPVGSVCI
ncbi:uncharacterized protein [Amphiura filiformis]|uniref:uncharacterized protein n=1 Tax=Amphiura filiformis TaxID=82378 RepID=UPI003B21CFB2